MKVCFLLLLIQLHVTEDAPTRPSAPTPVIITTSPNPKPETPTNPHPHYTTIIIICTAAGVLLILGGVMCWKHREQRRGQTETDVGQTGQRRQQDGKNDSDVLYTVINPQTPSNKEEKDDVMYSTVVHSNTITSVHTPVISEETTLYASIQTN
ncbi:uncharacterized protein Hap1MRO34_002871 isoform 3-T3 [Clarias gariepinus]|uniref:uncharacterized protein LOC128508568 isoform X4 n=1 Tax=Clarias gariepinus TaxID=13013 RepID=UPI00234CB809|nr:uncharacterized protein LOC128508568 isoform X4 [Clarias gariepinus]